MRYHWIRDHVRQGQYVVTWRQGTDNLADFFTKPLPVHVHQSLMPLLVHIPPATTQACLSKSADRAAKWSTNKISMALKHLSVDPTVPDLISLDVDPTAPVY